MITRRKFLHGLGIGAATAAVAPKLLADVNIPVASEPTGKSIAPDVPIGVARSHEFLFAMEQQLFDNSYGLGDTLGLIHQPMSRTHLLRGRAQQLGIFIRAYVPGEPLSYELPEMHNRPHAAFAVAVGDDMLLNEHLWPEFGNRLIKQLDTYYAHA